ncbi:hypothetical protein G6F54_014261 [Rhizopus delemar]|nr:hypothetical protein G6F54_014261 [Rhizopus delemar]
MQPASAARRHHGREIRDDLVAQPQHQAQQEGQAEHRMAEAVQAQAHQLQALGHGRLAHGLGQVDQDARQVFTQ